MNGKAPDSLWTETVHGSSVAYSLPILLQRLPYLCLAWQASSRYVVLFMCQMTPLSIASI